MKNIHFEGFNREGLRNLGIEFLEKQEEMLFLEYVNSCLEQRIWKAVFNEIAYCKDDYLTQSQDNPIKSLDMPLWLCRLEKIIKKEKQLQKGEIIEQCSKMSRLKKTRELKWLGTPIDEFDLKIRPYNVLKRAGFYTVGDVMENRESINYKMLGLKGAAELYELLFKGHKQAIAQTPDE